ncbi:rRNA maturation RNAse YbeY [Sulfurihydrogenibium yellowstonense]|nr:rRNA maturation RNAse YbeY [Sulfurihydrogenibium yellowstonense]
MLHLLGYDHETNEEDAKIMFELQDKIFDKLTCELKRP